MNIIEEIAPAQHVAEHIVWQAIRILEPATKDQIINYATERGLTEKETLRALKKFKKSKNKTIVEEQMTMMGNVDKNTCEALGGAIINGKCVIIKQISKPVKSHTVYKKA